MVRFHLFFVKRIQGLWLNAETKDILTNSTVRKRDKEVYMANDELNLSMFKAYDIRTKEGRLDEAMARRLLASVACYMKDTLKVSTIVMGHDARLGVPGLMQQAVDMFPYFGLNLVVNPLQISTPQFYFACMQNPQACGIMFTASHNPGEYVGMKMIMPPMAPITYGSGPEGGIERIKQLYIEDRAPSLTSNLGKVTVRRYMDHYMDYSMELARTGIHSLDGLDILCDFLSGAAGTEMTEALTYCGANVTTLHLIPNGRFPAGDPNPIILTSIEEAQNRMQDGGYDFGLLFDGDGDRMDIMAGNALQLAPSFNFSILLPQIASLYRTTYPRISTYADVKANPLAQRIQSNYANVKLIRNGHSFIKEALMEEQKTGTVAACEESGHYYMNFPYDPKDFSKGFAATENTLFYALLTARMHKEKPDAYAKALDMQERTIREREWTVHFDDPQRMKDVMERIDSTFKAQGLTCFDSSPDGKPLDASLIRYNLPLQITKDTDLESGWYQIVQRQSRSEDNMVRWEITGSDWTTVGKAKETIDSIVNA